MSEGWPKSKVGSIGEFVERLSTFSIRPELIYRGEATIHPHLQASLDRKVPKTCAFQKRFDEEEELIRSFRDQAERFLGERELLHVKARKIDCMTVMQHFGAPTRLLDWTESFMVAAYFACIDDWGLDGAIWWINSEAVKDSLHGHWEDRGFNLLPNGSVDLENSIFKPDVYELITGWYLATSFPRAEVQGGRFTIGIRYAMDHDVVLKRQVPEGQYGRIMIPAKLKGSVIEYLKQEKINAVSLQHAGADRVGLRMAWDLEQKRNPLTASILPTASKAHN